VTPDDDITVLVTVSPIPSHPTTTIIDDCLNTVRARLPHARIIICADGTRPDLEHRTVAYQQHLDTVGGYDHVELVRWAEWQHQARMVRHALDNLVTTPLVLFMEHDTTLQDTIGFDALVNVVHSGEAKCVRFHHESQVLAEHEWLNVRGGQVEWVQGVPLIATAQFSGRPHLADTDWYRRLLGPDFFNPESRTFVEDVAHGAILTAYKDHGRAGWDQHRLFIYAEPDAAGSIQRSNTVDGRQDDPKADCDILPLEPAP